jgi:CO/xanthine dehydrogenase Mo-binding subunit
VKPSFGGGDRNAAHVYDIPMSRVVVHWLEMAVLRASSLRSLGGWANTTATECFMDELAAAANADPVAFRLRHLHDPRAREVIERAATAANWQPGPIRSFRPSRSGTVTGQGIAFSRYESRFAYVAAVADVEVEPSSGGVRVRRVVVAHDCGRIINPDGVRNQVEGNVIQGVSRALKEEVTWDAHAVTSLTWETYPILTFPEVPDVDVILIDRPDQPPWGAGEPAICVVAAAIANAVHAATGARLRTLPFTPERVRAGLG